MTDTLIAMFECDQCPLNCKVTFRYEGTFRTPRGCLMHPMTITPKFREVRS